MSQAVAVEERLKEVTLESSPKVATTVLPSAIHAMAWVAAVQVQLQLQVQLQVQLARPFLWQQSRTRFRTLTVFSPLSGCRTRLHQPSEEPFLLAVALLPPLPI